MNQTSFKTGNKAAEKWGENEVKALFDKMYENACSDSEILCFSDACYSVGSKDSNIDYLIKKFPVFETFKKDIQKRIVSRINTGALKNKMNATAAIWRSKQLGEKDTQHQTLDATIDNISELTPEQRAERINKLKQKLNAD